MDFSPRLDKGNLSGFTSQLSQFECGGQVRKSNKIATVFDLGSRLTLTSSLDTSEGKIVRFTLKNSSSLVLSKIAPGLGSDSTNFSRVTAFTPRNSMLPTRYCTCWSILTTKSTVLRSSSTSVSGSGVIST